MGNLSSHMSFFFFFKLASMTRQKALAQASCAVFWVCISRKLSAEPLIQVLEVLSGQPGRVAFPIFLLLRPPPAGSPAHVLSLTQTHPSVKLLPWLSWSLFTPNTILGTSKCTWRPLQMWINAPAQWQKPTDHSWRWTQGSACHVWPRSFSSVQLLSRVQLFVTPWTAAHQASLSITNSRSLLKLTSIESVMPSNHLILCHPFLLSPSIFPSIRVFSNESVLHIRWPKALEFQLQYQSFQWIFRTDFL